MAHERPSQPGSQLQFPEVMSQTPCPLQFFGHSAIEQLLPCHPGSHEQFPPRMHTPCTHPPTSAQSCRTLQFLPSHPWSHTQGEKVCVGSQLPCPLQCAQVPESWSPALAWHVSPPEPSAGHVDIVSDSIRCPLATSSSVRMRRLAAATQSLERRCGPATRHPFAVMLTSVPACLVVPPLCRAALSSLCMLCSTSPGTLSPRGRA